MTPTTTEQAKVNPWWVDELTLHWGHGHSSHDTRRAAKTAIDQVEALTKERDEYRLLGDAMVAGHKVERDELRMQIDSLCHEVAAIPAIKEERDALAADAARYQWVKKQTRAFSLDMGGQHSWAVTGSFSRAKGPSLDEAIDAAIQEAGVQ